VGITAGSLVKVLLVPPFLRLSLLTRLIRIFGIILEDFGAENLEEEGEEVGTYLTNWWTRWFMDAILRGP